MRARKKGTVLVASYDMHGLVALGLFCLLSYWTSPWEHTCRVCVQYSLVVMYVRKKCGWVRGRECSSYTGFLALVKGLLYLSLSVVDALSL